jgi:cell division protein ZapA
MAQMEFQIMGQAYTLGCPPGGEASLQAAVSKVDEAMCKIRDAGKIKARDRIAVLAALNIAVVSAGAGSNAPASVDTASQARLNALASRLDAALHADGQLI